MVTYIEHPLIMPNSAEARIYQQVLAANVLKNGNTMIVAPNYAIGVTKDIDGENSVIVKSAILANYIYQSILKNGRDISYSVLDNIVQKYIGKDITNVVSAYVYDNFGHGAEDISLKRI